jgi:hypothetical protein
MFFSENSKIEGAIMIDTLTLGMQSASTEVLDGLPHDADTMFADHNGVYKRRIEKKQRKLARKLPFLNGFLEDGENLLVITTAISPMSLFEWLTTGFVFLYIKRCLLVVTNKRIFHIPTTMNYDYRRSIAQIRYGDISSISQKGTWLKIEYQSGAKDLFLNVRLAERKKIRAQLSALSLNGPSSKSRTRGHLCPRCSMELLHDNYECPSCGLEFKSRKKAITRSIWFPGGGYFYTGHPLLGIADAFLELILILLAVVHLIPNAEYPNAQPALAITFGVILIIEKLITIYHANRYAKEYLTKEKKIKPIGHFD